jgi:hypothetical protein
VAAREQLAREMAELAGEVLMDEEKFQRRLRTKEAGRSVAASPGLLRFK